MTEISWGWRWREHLTIKGKPKGEFGKETELFYILIVVVGTQIYSGNKTPKTGQRRVTLLYVKF